MVHHLQEKLGIGLGYSTRYDTKGNEVTSKDIQMLSTAKHVFAQLPSQNGAVMILPLVHTLNNELACLFSLVNLLPKRCKRIIHRCIECKSLLLVSDIWWGKSYANVRSSRCYGTKHDYEGQTNTNATDTDATAVATTAGVAATLAAPLLPRVALPLGCSGAQVLAGVGRLASCGG